MKADLEPRSAPRRSFEDPGSPAVRATVCTGTAETHYLRAGTGPSVVLLPGATSLVASLAGRFRVILPQEVRHREAGGTETTVWLRDFLDGLGLQRVSLVAGGEAEALALRFTRETPERVERLVLLGATAPGASSAEELAERVIRSLNAADIPAAAAAGAADLPLSRR